MTATFRASALFGPLLGSAQSGVALGPALQWQKSSCWVKTVSPVQVAPWNTCRRPLPSVHVVVIPAQRRS
jgi:hypothetical protein